MINSACPPQRCMVGTARNAPLPTLRSAKPALPKKRDGLLDRQRVSQQRRMRYADHNMVNHADEPGVLNRYPPVMRLRQQCRRYRVDRPVSRDDADRVIDRWSDRVERRVALGDELLSGRS